MYVIKSLDIVPDSTQYIFAITRHKQYVVTRVNIDSIYSSS